MAPTACWPSKTHNGEEERSLRNGIEGPRTKGKTKRNSGSTHATVAEDQATEEPIVEDQTQLESKSFNSCRLSFKPCSKKETGSQRPSLQVSERSKHQLRQQKSGNS